MITRIEIDGFKSFRNFAVDLRPFQVIVGPNGVGKSNLFDAIVLLSDLATYDSIYEVFRKNRGRASELFTLLPDGSRAEEMTFAVEMLLPAKVSDGLHPEDSLPTTRVRYEIGVGRIKSESTIQQLFVSHEELRSISGDADIWVEANISVDQRNKFARYDSRAPQKFIVVENGENGGHYTILSDGVSSQHRAVKSESVENRTQTILSSIDASGIVSIIAYATRQEMRRWKFLQLNPTALRQPSDFYAPGSLERDGGNLATVIARLQEQDDHALTDISRTMRRYVPGVSQVKIDASEDQQTYSIRAQMKDGGTFSSGLLSDGTLRLLAFATLANDPRHEGVLLIEEPENGVQPEMLGNVVALLRGNVTDFSSDVPDALLQQVIVNTHSTQLLACVDSDDVLLVFMPENKKETYATPITDVLLAKGDENEARKRRYGAGRVQQFLERVAQSLQEQATKIAPDFEVIEL